MNTYLVLLTFSRKFSRYKIRFTIQSCRILITRISWQHQIFSISPSKTSKRFWILTPLHKVQIPLPELIQVCSWWRPGPKPGAYRQRSADRTKWSVVCFRYPRSPMLLAGDIWIQIKVFVSDPARRTIWIFIEVQITVKKFSLKYLWLGWLATSTY